MVIKVIQWDESFSVGIEIIDEQHKSLIGITNDLIYTYQEKNKESSLETILQGLIDYTIYHFEAEELIAQEIGLKNITDHQKEHQHFIDKITEIQNEMELNSDDITSELLTYLKNWLVTHVKIDDKNLFINSADD